MKLNPKQMLREWLGVYEPPAAVERLLTNGDFRKEAAYGSPAELIRESVKAWQQNPLARRIIALTSQYVIGKGIQFSTDRPAEDTFLRAFWNHPLNRMNLRVVDWCEELSRTGNLFILISSDPSGMSYVRAVPVQLIQAIHTRENDGEQPLSYEMRSSEYALETTRIPAVSPLLPPSQPVMLHFTVNRAIGSLWGEPDLAPLLKWLSRYSNWLEDRARLNRYRNSFLFVVKTRLVSEAQRLQRQSQLNAIPPAPGSILVTNENEDWSVLSPKLESNEAREDGLSLKKMIAAGAGIPLHFLAEPESENKASAESAGSVAYRHFEQRQQRFLEMLREVLSQVLTRAAMVDPRLNADAAIALFGDDISTVDNVGLSEATAKITPTLTHLYQEGLISAAEYLRLTYRFMGEALPDQLEKHGEAL